MWSFLSSFVKNFKNSYFLEIYTEVYISLFAWKIYNKKDRWSKYGKVLITGEPQGWVNGGSTISVRWDMF